MRNIINNTCKTLYTILIFYKYIILKSGPAGVAHVTCPKNFRSLGTELGVIHKIF